MVETCVQHDYNMCNFCTIFAQVLLSCSILSCAKAEKDWKSLPILRGIVKMQKFSDFPQLSHNELHGLEGDGPRPDTWMLGNRAFDTITSEWRLHACACIGTVETTSEMCRDSLRSKLLTLRGSSAESLKLCNFRSISTISVAGQVGMVFIHSPGYSNDDLTAVRKTEKGILTFPYYQGPTF